MRASCSHAPAVDEHGRPSDLLVDDRCPPRRLQCGFNGGATSHGGEARRCAAVHALPAAPGWESRQCRACANALWPMMGLPWFRGGAVLLPYSVARASSSSPPPPSRLRLLQCSALQPPPSWASFAPAPFSPLALCVPPSSFPVMARESRCCWATGETRCSKERESQECRWQRLESQNAATGAATAGPATMPQFSSFCRCRALRGNCWSRSNGT
jgi:hypothetical protein